MQISKCYPLIVMLVVLLASSSLFAGGADISRQIRSIVKAEKKIIEERMEELTKAYEQQEALDPLVWEEEGDDIENSNTFYQIKDALRQIDIGLIMEWEMLKFTPESVGELRQYVKDLKSFEEKSTADAIKKAKRARLDDYVKAGGDFDKINDLMEQGILNLQSSQEESAAQELQEALAAFEEFKKGRQEITAIYAGLCQ